MTQAIPAKPADPMPAPVLGMWLFLASEAMFFAGLLSAFLVLQSSPGERALFVRSAAVVNLPLTIAAAVLLIATAAVLWKQSHRAAAQASAGMLAAVFLAVQAASANRLLSHHTVVTPTAVYDGHVAASNITLQVTGVRLPLPPNFDVYGTVPADLRRAGGVGGTYAVLSADVRADAAYGPSRNNYFACYFLVTTAHALHVAGGLLALAWLIVRTRRHTATATQTHAVVLYWQFVNGVGLLSLLLLYLG